MYNDTFEKTKDQFENFINFLVVEGGKDKFEKTKDISDNFINFLVV